MKNRPCAKKKLLKVKTKSVLESPFLTFDALFFRLGLDIDNFYPLKVDFVNV
jgi:hypothetical protein